MIRSAFRFWPNVLQDGTVPASTFAGSNGDGYVGVHHGTVTEVSAVGQASLL